MPTLRARLQLRSLRSRNVKARGGVVCLGSSWGRDRGRRGQGAAAGILVYHRLSDEVAGSLLSGVKYQLKQLGSKENPRRWKTVRALRLVIWRLRSVVYCLFYGRVL